MPPPAEPTLLDEFLAEDRSPFVRRLIEDAITDVVNVRPTFELNRFDITVDRASRTVVVQDVLDTSERGSLTVSLDEFMRRLGDCGAKG